MRFPTVAELYGATSTTNALFINDPALRPERSWTGELSAEKDLGGNLLRLTAFAEDTRDALYTQTTFDALANRNVSRVQNVGRIATQGLEVAWTGTGVWLPALDLNASVTWADSVIKENAGFVSVPGDTIGKRQPNIPQARAAAVASYRWSPRWTTIAGRPLQRPPVPHPGQQRHQRQRLHGREPPVRGGPARARADRQDLQCRPGHRQRQQPDVLEFPPLPAAHVTSPNCGPTYDHASQPPPPHRSRWPPARPRPMSACWSRPRPPAAASRRSSRSATAAARRRPGRSA